MVSFLFEDAVWCDWLYREFDGERIPRPLISRPSRFGTPYPDRISVSPDPADPTQLETYAESLRSAQHLILVVSPISGKSPVLEEHIRQFKAASGDERVIALVVKGEPASPAAEPGSVEDVNWLPNWLKWRFENNAFKPGPRTEPLVVDARMGVSSLAEARAQIMAALLEIDRAELNELGIVTRPTTSLIEFPSQAQLDAVPSATPSSHKFVEIAEAVPEQARHSNLPVWLCGGAAAAALAFLLWSPDQLMGQGLHQHEKRSVASMLPPQVDFEVPLVEARPMLEAPMPGMPAFTPVLEQVPSRTPMIAEQSAAQVTITAPASAAPGTPAPEISSAMRSALFGERERLTRLAESQMSEGQSQEALETLNRALEKAKEITALPDPSAAELLDLCQLYRRTGTLAEGLGLPAVARGHYENGRRTLVDWRSSAPRPKESLKMLADFESSLRGRM